MTLTGVRAVVEHVLALPGPAGRHAGSRRSPMPTARSAPGSSRAWPAWATCGATRKSAGASSSRSPRTATPRSLWPAMARYAARVNNFDSQNRPVSVELFQHSRLLPPPGGCRSADRRSSRSRPGRRVHRRHSSRGPETRGRDNEANPARLERVLVQPRVIGPAGPVPAGASASGPWCTACCCSPSASSGSRTGACCRRAEAWIYNARGSAPGRGCERTEPAVPARGGPLPDAALRRVPAGRAVPDAGAVDADQRRPGLPGPDACCTTGTRPIHNSGDTVMIVLSIYLLLSPAGAACSLDRLWRIFRGKEDDAPPLIVPWAQRLMQIQIAVLYLCASLSKMTGPQWADGTAVYYPAAPARVGPVPDAGPGQHLRHQPDDLGNDGRGVRAGDLRLGAAPAPVRPGGGRRCCTWGSNTPSTSPCSRP